MANVRSGADRRTTERGEDRRDSSLFDLFSLCKRHLANAERISALLSYPETLRPTAAEYRARDEASVLAIENSFLMIFIEGGAK